MSKTKKQLEEDLQERNEELDAQNEELTAAIEQLMRRNDELNQLNEELSKRNSELDQVIYRTYHDLKSPVVSILGLCNIIKTENPGLEITTSQIESMAKKMGTLVQSLQFFARNVKEPVENSPVDFEELLNSVLRELKPIEEVDVTNHHIVVKQTEKFNSDPFRIKLILANLICNALIFRMNNNLDHSVNIDIHATRDICIIHIKDTGIGMDPEALKSSVDFFFRGSQLSKGAGIGLYVVKSAVEKLNGTLEVDSKPMKGTSVKVTIPNLSGDVKALKHT